MDRWDQKEVRAIPEWPAILESKETRGPLVSQEIKERAERRVREEPQETLADQAHRDTRVWQVQWAPEDWRENQAFRGHLVPEVSLAQE